MKFLPLIWAGLWRRPSRSIFTGLCIAIAFLLLGLLEGVNAGFAKSIADAHRDLLVTDTRVRGGAQMPIAALAKIRALPGVAEVTQRAYFTGVFGDLELKNTIAAIATEPEAWFRLRPQLAAEKAAVLAMQNDRMGMLATPPLLKQFAWKVGDTITLRSKILKSDGSGEWVFHIVGVFDAASEPTRAAFGIINYAYLDEYRVENRGTAERFMLRITDPTKAVATAATIDRIFANSPYETRTRSDQQRAEAQAKQLGDIAFFTNAITGAVLFTLAFLTGNTLRQSLQERIPEFAILKSLGYGDMRILVIAIAEALLLCLPPAMLGLLVAYFIAPLAKADIGAIAVTPRVALLGLGCAALLALVGVAFPARNLARMSIVASLGKR